MKCPACNSNLDPKEVVGINGEYAVFCFKCRELHFFPKVEERNFEKCPKIFLRLASFLGRFF